MFFVLNNSEITSRSSESDYRQLRVVTKAYSNTFKSLPKVTQVDKAACQEHRSITVWRLITFMTWQTTFMPSE